MDKDQFWGIVGRALEAEPTDVEERGEIVTDELCDLGVEQVIGYDRMYAEKAIDLYNWDMVMAATLLLGELDSQRFDDVRAWVMSRGRATFKAVRAEPDSLAEFVGEGRNPDGTFEAPTFRRAASVAYDEMEGHAIPEAFPPPAEPLGEPWDDSDEQLRDRLPRLYAAIRGGS